MDDIDEDDLHPNHLLFKKKTCPCCRAVILSRPIPLFLVKSITSAYTQAKAIPGMVRPSTPVPGADPWAGIFSEVAQDDDEDEWSGDEEDEDGSLDDEDEYDDPWPYEGYGYGTDTDEERYEGMYVMPRWAPPNVYVLPGDYGFDGPLSESDLALLRRGATQQMIDLFAMEYTHERGIKAVLDDGNIVYLGWNIVLHEDDSTGEHYMEWVAADIFDRRERWQLLFNVVNSGWTACRLVPEDEDEEYPVSDSDIWDLE